MQQLSPQGSQKALALARRLTRNEADAEDLVQAVMLRILARGKETVSLATLLRDEWRNMVRERDAARSARAGAVEVGASCVRDDGVADDGMTEEWGAEAAEILDVTLREPGGDTNRRKKKSAAEERRVLELRTNGLNDREAAEQLAISTRTANRLRHRAMGRLRMLPDFAHIGPAAVAM